MKVEYEAKFIQIDVQALKKAVASAGGTCVRSDFIQKRVTFDLPGDRASTSAWIRLRDEGDRTTLTLKSVDERTIEGQKEILVTVDDFDSTASLMEAIGCRRKSYQESRRELWKIGTTEITFDTWPFLDTFVEIEGGSTEEVKAASALLGLEYAEAIFGTVNTLYKARYGKTIDDLDPADRANFVFEGKNPFLKRG